MRPLFAALAALSAVAVLAAACDNGSQSDETTRNESGQVQEGGDVGVFRLQVGDCLNEDIVTEQSSIPVVPCDEPHDSQRCFTAYLGNLANEVLDRLNC